MKTSLATRVFVVILLSLLVAFWSMLEIGSEDLRAEAEKSSLREMIALSGMAHMALLSSDPEKRLSLLDGLDDFAGVSAALSPKGEVRCAQKVSSNMIAEIRLSLGADVEACRMSDGRGVVFRFPLGDDMLSVSVNYPERDMPSLDLRWFLTVLIVSVLGAWFVAAGISRPISALAAAMRSVGKGGRFVEKRKTGFLEISEVGILESEFDAMRLLLSESEKERDEILAGLSHDMRTPLSRIMLSAEFAPDEIRSSIQEDVSSLDLMLKGFVEFVKTGRQGEREEFDVKDLVSSAVLSSTPKGKMSSLDILPTVPEKALGYPKELSRAIGNVVANAWKYGCASVKVELSFSSGRFTLSVEDDGDGFGESPENLLKPFVRGNATRTGADGSGLGLAIVNRALRLHGGSVTFPPAAKGGLIRLEW